MSRIYQSIETTMNFGKKNNTYSNLILQVFLFFIYFLPLDHKVSRSPVEKFMELPSYS